MNSIKKTVGRPKKNENEKRSFVGIRLPQSTRKEIEFIGKDKGVGEGVRYLYEQYKIWTKIENKIKTKMKAQISLFIENFSLFVRATRSHHPNLKQVKKDVIRSAKELYFLSDLLDDNHNYLEKEIGLVHFNGLKEVWRITKVADNTAKDTDFPLSHFQEKNSFGHST